MHENLLKKCNIFSELNPQLLRAFCTGSFIKTYKAGQIVFSAHVEPDKLYIVQQGLIQLNFSSFHRHEGLAGFIGKQSIGLGLEVILNKPITVQGKAVVETVVLVLQKDKFLSNYNTDRQLLSKLLTLQLEQSYFFLKTYEMSVSATSEAQIAATFICLYVVTLSHGEDISYSNVDIAKICRNNSAVELAYSQEELASLCTVTRQTLTKVLNVWRKNDWIETCSKRLLVKNISRIVETRNYWRDLDIHALKTGLPQAQGMG